MAINPVSNLYKGFIFDNENSRTYGVYVTDVKVFGAPKRDVEMITIPGRNGEFALDKGHFENIEVVYECAMGADTEADFADGISNFRNMLASRKGYKTLSDEINSAEYRMAVFKDGLDVDTENRETGTFEVKFNCKPQRFLDLGDTPVSVANNGTITNPTLFESSPLLEVDGYGDFSVGGVGMNIAQGALVGKVALPSYDTNIGCTINGSGDEVLSGQRRFPQISQYAITGDTITSCTVVASLCLRYTGNIADMQILSKTDGTDYLRIGYCGHIDDVIYVNMVFNPTQFTNGTTAHKTDTSGIVVSVTDENNQTTTEAIILIGYLHYSATYQYIYPEAVYDIAANTNNMTVDAATAKMCILDFTDAVSVNSTKSALGSLYIDMDIGECYQLSGGAVVPINYAVTLPAELPTLKPGTNTITYDNTITSFKVTPRWWKV